MVTYELSWFSEWLQKPLTVGAVLATVYAGVWAVKRIEWAI